MLKISLKTVAYQSKMLKAELCELKLSIMDEICEVQNSISDIKTKKRCTQ